MRQDLHASLASYVRDSVKRSTPQPQPPAPAAPAPAPPPPPQAKGQYGYESWQGITSKQSKSEKDAAGSADPTSGIMDMMKQMHGARSNTVSGLTRCQLEHSGRPARGG